jgi:hypothetical protein
MLRRNTFTQKISPKLYILQYRTILNDLIFKLIIVFYENNYNNRSFKTLI